MNAYTITFGLFSIVYHLLRLPVLFSIARLSVQSTG